MARRDEHEIRVSVVMLQTLHLSLLHDPAAT